MSIPESSLFDNYTDPNPDCPGNHRLIADYLSRRIGIGDYYQNAFHSSDTCPTCNNIVSVSMQETTGRLTVTVLSGPESPNLTNQQAR